MCCMVAACIVYGGLFGIVAMCALAAFLLLKSSRLHKKEPRTRRWRRWPITGTGLRRPLQ